MWTTEIPWLGTAGTFKDRLSNRMERPQITSFTPIFMEHPDAVRITLRLPRDVAQDIIVRHALKAREWRQLPFDPLQAPVEILDLDDPSETSTMNSRMLPWLLDSILRMVGDEGWSVRYDRQTAVEVAGAVCAYALEAGVRLTSEPTLHALPRLVPMARLPMWLN